MRPPIALAALFLLFLTNLIFAAPVSANVVASLTVKPACVFAVSYNTLATYTRIGTIQTSYTLNTLSACTINSMNGNFALTEVDSGNVVVFNNLVANNIGFSPLTTNLPVNTMTLTNTLYSGTVTFSYQTYTISSTSTFTLINPQNLTIKNLTAPSSLSLGSQLNIQVGAQNIGQLASGQATLYLNITGPGKINGVYTEPSLSPGQGATYTITLNNATQSAGTYTIKAYETYLVNNVINTTNSQTAQYTVTSTPQSVGGAGGNSAATQSTTPVTPVPSLSITTIPLYMSLGTGTSALQTLGFQNTGSAPTVVNLKIPQSFQNFMALSSSSFTLPPNQQLSVQLFIKANATISTGTYVLPISINLNSGGTIANQTEYISFNIYSPANSSVQVVNQITLSNNTNVAHGIIQVNNPTAKSVSNLTLQTLIPLALADSISQISTTGLAATIVDPPAFYTITWTIPQISPKSSVYGYYSINKPRIQNLLQVIQNVLATPSVPSPSSILKVVNIAFPTFYVNSTNKISIYALYTGTLNQPVQFTLTAPSGISIRNSSQIVNASPNQLLNPSFIVSSGQNPGTYLMNLYISTQGFNATYSLPLIALNPPPPVGSTTTIPVSALLNSNTIRALAGAIALIIIALIIVLLRGYFSKPRYRKETSEQLVRLREQIKRSENE